MRLFFALWPAAAAAAELEKIAQRCHEFYRGKPTRTQTIHITLAFLGDVDDDRVDDVITAGNGVGRQAFELVVDRIGYWRHNRLLWAGVAPSDALADLVDRLRGALKTAGFTIDDEGRRFVPHITLIRKVAGTEHRSALPSIEPIRWPCTRFVLVRSRLSTAGPDYEVMAEYPLPAPTPE